jgi:hypothetical protein
VRDRSLLTASTAAPVSPSTYRIQRNGHSRLGPLPSALAARPVIRGGRRSPSAAIEKGTLPIRYALTEAEGPQSHDSG